MKSNRLSWSFTSLRWAVYSAVAVAMLGRASVGECKAPTNDRATAVDPVRGVLEQEASGELRDRRAALEALPPAAASTPLAQWSLGNLRRGKRWAPLESVVEDAAYQKKLGEYRRVRAAAAEKLREEPESLLHRQLANWCRTQKLPEQEWLHLTKAVQSDPKDVSSHTRLGNELIQGVWFSRNEINAAQEKSLAISSKLADWLPRLRPIVVAQQSSDPARRTAAFEQLQKLVHPDAVPAIQVALAVVDEPLSLELVKLLAEIETPDAAVALVQVALADTYGAVGDAAIKALREFPRDYYVPALLGALSSPTTQKFAIFQGNHGELMLQQALFRETQSRRSVEHTLKTVQFDSWQRHVTHFSIFSVVFGWLGHTQFHEMGRRSPNLPLSVEEQLARRAAQNAFRHEANRQKDQVDAENSRTEELNRRIYHVLGLTTDAQIPSEAQAWWQWWYDQNELYVPQEQKPTQIAYQYQGQVVPVLTQTSDIEVFQFSCLVAGTLVQTAEGLRPVDAILPGDLVLSQDPESGELAYKPVLFRTVRPPAPIVAIETAENVIRATGGHLFWVAGRGWVRARMLTPEMALHDVHGTTEILGVTAEAEKQEAYNLIVADFHTYFVGPERVLSYDNTPLRPTTAKVPGLASHEGESH